MHRILSTLMVAVCLFVPAPHAAHAQDDSQTRGIEVVTRDVDDPASALIYRDQYALVIGVNEYEDDFIPDLQYAVNDAVAIRDMLMQTYGFPYENITVLTDSMATRQNIIEALYRYSESDIEPNSQLLVYYAGHGTTTNNRTGSIGWIMPTDAIQNSVARNGIRMDEISGIARGARPKHVLFLMDACYGGLTSSRASASGATKVRVRNLLMQPAHQLITAGSADEEVVESAEWGHSAFTTALLKGLGQGAADRTGEGIISVTDLYGYIQGNVPYLAQSKNGKQTPQMSKLSPESGEFLFIQDPTVLGDLTVGEEEGGFELELGEEEVTKKFTTPVTITANVDMADLAVEGRQQGYLRDGRLTFDITPGFYQIELTKDKYRPVRSRIEVMPDTILSFDFDMDYLYSRVHFDIQPSDATVYYNAEYIGSGTFVWEVPKGRAQFDIMKPGYKPVVRTANITQDTTHLAFNMEAINAQVQIESTPTSALLTLNSDTLGFTPHIFSLPFGEHRLLLQKEGYRDELIPISVTEEAIIPHSIVMRRTAESLARERFQADIKKGVSGLAWNAAFTAGFMFAYGQRENLAEQIWKVDEPSQIPEDEQNIYDIGRYTVLGLAGIMGLATIKSIGYLASRKYDTYYEEEVEREFKERVNVGALYTGKGFMLTASVRF